MRIECQITSNIEPLASKAEDYNQILVVVVYSR